MSGEFDFWGDNICAEAYTASSVPGYLARLDLSTTLDGKRCEFALRMTEFFVASRAIQAGQPLVESEVRFVTTASRDHAPPPMIGR